jgi:DNA-3-methyladenine glycosylase II
MVLRRPDVWPRGDLALLKALKEVKGLDDVPDNDRAYEIALAWSPWRAVAARILWHHYLSTR